MEGRVKWNGVGARYGTVNGRTWKERIKWDGVGQGRVR